MADGMFLRFESHGRKLYAKLPDGEFGYGDSQGLYEWRRFFDPGADRRLFPDGMVLARIHYTGGDRQASDRNGFFRSGPELPGRTLPYPHELGFQAAVHPVRMN